MKTLILFMLLAVYYTYAGDNNTSISTTNGYYPLHVGNKWT